MCIQQVEPATEKAASYVFILKIMAVCQVIVSILNIISNNYFIRHGIFGCFLCLVLILSQHLVSFQILLIQIIVSVYFTLDFLIAFLTYFQNGTNVNQSSSTAKFQFAVIIISFIYYAIISIFAYFPYKEFKRISFRNNPALNPIFQRSQDSEQSQQGKVVPYSPAYGDIIVNPRQRNNQNGIFEVPKGQGIKL